MAEHRWTVERITKSRRTPPGETRTVTYHRAVCSCGYATNYSVDPGRVRKQRDRHALEGQTSLTW